MSACTPECLTGDPDTMSSQCVRALQEENKQLKADADRVAAACNVEMADLSTRWNAAEARIDAALALHTEVFVGDGTGCVCGWPWSACGWPWSAGRCNSPTVKALKGEK